MRTTKYPTLLALFGLVGFGQNVTVHHQEPKESAEHARLRLNLTAQFDVRGDITHKSLAAYGEMHRLSHLRLEASRTTQSLEPEATKNNLRMAALEYEVAELESAKKASDEIEELLNVQLEHVDECVIIFRRTIDKRTSLLTVRETEQVKACQSMQLYPIAK
jgi:hypothetical protein